MAKNQDSPTRAVRVGVTFRAPNDKQQVKEALHELRRFGFTVSNVGNATASLRGTRKQYEALTKTQLAWSEIGGAAALLDSSADHTLESSLAALVNNVSVQPPYVIPGFDAVGLNKFSNLKNSTAPKIDPAFDPPHANFVHLEPDDIPVRLNAASVHAAGHTGQGIRVVVIDSGFADHPYYSHRGLVVHRFLAGSATNIDLDPFGHGTAIVANLFAVAPGATVFGVKLGSPDSTQPGASLLEGFQTAIKLNPHIISMSTGADVRTGPLAPNQICLRDEIDAAVEAGVVVVAAAGNGEFMFPAQMPNVIAVGGVFVNGDHREASNLASAFRSEIFDRAVPDVCGLVGMSDDRYIALPVPPRSAMDALPDGTKSSDGWAFFSGTSAAAPQVAGVCALMLGKDSGLGPADVKARLMGTAVDIQLGAANSSMEPGQPGLSAGNGFDSATGAGLVDAARACGLA
jgi:subtilisin family serine protease